MSNIDDVLQRVTAEQLGVDLGTFKAVHQMFKDTCQVAFYKELKELPKVIITDPSSQLVVCHHYKLHLITDPVLDWFLYSPEVESLDGKGKISFAMMLVWLINRIESPHVDDVKRAEYTKTFNNHFFNLSKKYASMHEDMLKIVCMIPYFVGLKREYVAVTTDDSVRIQLLRTYHPE